MYVWIEAVHKTTELVQLVPRMAVVLSQFSCIIPSMIPKLIM